MKQGTIVYLADAHAIPEGLSPDDRGADAAPVLFAASRAGFYDVPRALLALVARGCGRVDLARGRVGPNGAVALSTERLHLWG